MTVQYYTGRYELNKRLYKKVAASTTETLDFVPISGQSYKIIKMGVSSSAVPNTISSIIWDPDGTPEILLSSYGEALHSNVDIIVTGDGIKILRIQLTNDLTEVAYMGSFYQAVKS